MNKLGQLRAMTTANKRTGRNEGKIKPHTDSKRQTETETHRHALDAFDAKEQVDCCVECTFHSCSIFQRSSKKGKLRADGNLDFLDCITNKAHTHCCCYFRLFFFSLLDTIITTIIDIEREDEEEEKQLSVLSVWAY